MNPAWYVVQSRPREEERCLAELGRRGFVAFCPRVREYRARRHRYEVAPFFPSYLFVRLDLDRDFNSARWAQGVKKLVSFGGPPVQVPPEIMESLFARTDGEGVVSLDQAIEPGDRVRFRTGPFKDLFGTVIRNASPKGRILVLMEILAGTARVEAGNEQVLVV